MHQMMLSPGSCLSSMIWPRNRIIFLLTARLMILPVNLRKRCMKRQQTSKIIYLKCEISLQKWLECISLSCRSTPSAKSTVSTSELSAWALESAAWTAKPAVWATESAAWAAKSAIWAAVWTSECGSKRCTVSIRPTKLHNEYRKVQAISQSLESFNQVGDGQIHQTNYEASTSQHPSSLGNLQGQVNLCCFGMNIV